MQNDRSPGFIAIGKAGRDRLLAEREVACALDEVLQEQVVGALLGLAQFELGAVEREPRRLADVVIGAINRRAVASGEGRFHRMGPVSFGSGRMESSKALYQACLVTSKIDGI